MDGGGSDSILEIVVGLNKTTLSYHLLSDVRLFNTPSCPRMHIWSVNIIGGWPDIRNPIAGGPMTLLGDSDTILEFMVGPNTFHKTGL